MRNATSRCWRRSSRPSRRRSPPVPARSSRRNATRPATPTRLSPFERAGPADARHRVAMLALARQGRPDWRIALDELDREPPSYTVDTLRALAARTPSELWLLMGTDTLATLGRWREPEEI